MRKLIDVLFVVLVWSIVVPCSAQLNGEVPSAPPASDGHSAGGMQGNMDMNDMMFPDSLWGADKSVCYSAPAWQYVSKKKHIKVACVGNSITYGYKLADPKTESYPAQLQQLLGSRYTVGNFGKSGATLLYRGHRPYVRQDEFRQAMLFAGDIVIIHLGINDTDPRDWPNYRDDFVKDYMALIDSFRAANPQCRILIARMTPIANRHPRFESGTRQWHSEIQQAIQRVAAYAHVQLIDFFSPLYDRPCLLPDAIHPNKEGAALLARTAFTAITGCNGGLRLSPLFSDNMVLQRDIPLRLNGQANVGDEVCVSIASQKVTARTNINGLWSLFLAPMPAGGPYVLSVSTKGKTLKYRNVMVGEVWLCSGQSNMAFALHQAASAARDIPISTNENIRLFDMKPRWQTDAVEWNASVLDSLNRLQYYKDTSWKVCSPLTTASFSAVAYYFGKMLQDSLRVPVGLICNAVGGSPAEAWVDRLSLESKFPELMRQWMQNDFIQDWVRQRAAQNIQKTVDPLQRHPYEPCYLYEAGILPLQQYPIKGVVWYQGESNANNCDTYNRLFHLLVEGWRHNWDNAAMPFYYVQLSSIDRPSWTWFRDSQRRLMYEIPHIGMAVSSDWGDSLNVHPTNKQPIGERLARWALNKTYGRVQTLPSGPLYRSVVLGDGAAFVLFDYADGMHASDGKALRSFELSEDGDHFYPAEAEVVGREVRVYSDKVKHPRFVRYGWQPFTRANLVNGSGLPASTFRTE